MEMAPEINPLQNRVWALEKALGEERKVWESEIHKLADMVKTLQVREKLLIQVISEGGGPISKEKSSKVNKS